jgi:hypothetical protein
VSVDTTQVPFTITADPVLSGRIAVPLVPRMSYSTAAHGLGSSAAVHCASLGSETKSIVAPPRAEPSDDDRASLSEDSREEPSWMAATFCAIEAVGSKTVSYAWVISPTVDVGGTGVVVGGAVVMVVIGTVPGGTVPGGTVPGGTVPVVALAMIGETDSPLGAEDTMPVAALLLA